MKKVHQSNVGLLPVNIILIKVTRNNMKFLSIEITRKKMSKQLGIFANRNYIKKKYVGMSWKFVAILFSANRRNTVTESTSIESVGL